MENLKKSLILINLILLAWNIFFFLFVVPSMGSIKRKPILYLYPEEDQTIEVRLEHEDLIRSSYPKYDNGWIVEASKDGNLRIGDKNYYALYWDEDDLFNVDFKEGFYVEASDAINFLEGKLDIIGLNEREANEFIMYWLPILENNKKNLVYFELTEERELDNKLIINPKPDSLLRVIIHIKKVNKKPTNLTEQKLSTFERKGFVAVEWGGIEHK